MPQNNLTDFQKKWIVVLDVYVLKCECNLGGDDCLYTLHKQLLKKVL